jgi:multiple sugar transport system permease protein
VKRKWNQRALNLLTWAIVVLTLSPVAFMVYASLSDYNDVVTGNMLKASFTPHWSNYREMWVNVDFLAFLRNSLIICGLTTLLSTLLASLAAYALARFRFRGNHAFSVAVSTTQVIPGMLFFLPLYMLYIQIDDAGLPMMNTFHGMIFLYTAMFTPASIWIMRGFFVSIPRDLEDAAVIDGCSRLGARPESSPRPRSCSCSRGTRCSSPGCSPRRPMCRQCPSACACTWASTPPATT